MPPDDLDVEKIGEHGTLLRIRLKDGVGIYDNPLKKLWLAYFAERINPMYRNTARDVFDCFDNNIHKIVSNFVALPPKNIEVKIRLNDGSKVPLVRYDQVFKWQEFNITDDAARDVYECAKRLDYHSFDIYAISKNWIALYDNSICHDGINFSWKLALPLSSFPDNESLNKFESLPTFGSEGLFIDGISVKNDRSSQHDYLDNLRQIGHLNFTGALRPQLSVDRLDIDHMLIGEVGVLVFETKARAKPAKGNTSIKYQNGQLVFSDGRQSKAELEQAQRNGESVLKLLLQLINDSNKASLRKFTQQHPLPLETCLVFPGWHVDYKSASGLDVNLSNDAMLFNFVSSKCAQKQRLSQKEADDLNEIFDAYLRKKKAHLIEV